MRNTILDLLYPKIPSQTGLQCEWNNARNCHEGNCECQLNHFLSIQSLTQSIKNLLHLHVHLN